MNAMADRLESAAKVLRGIVEEIRSDYGDDVCCDACADVVEAVEAGVERLAVDLEYEARTLRDQADARIAVPPPMPANQEVRRGGEIRERVRRKDGA